MFKSCDVAQSCCMYLTLSLNIDKFLIFWGFIFLFKDIIQDYFLVWIVILNLGSFTSHGFTCYSLSIDNFTFLYGFVYMVSLSLCQTHGLFVPNVIYFSTCLHFWWQKWGGAILAFCKFKYSTSPSGLLE